MINRIRSAASAFGLLVALGYLGPAQAEFTLDWTQDNVTPTFSGTTSEHSAGGNVTGQTPFIYERTFDGATAYYHMILGDPNSGFGQEVYIQVGSGTFQGFNGIGPGGSASSGTGTQSGNNLDPLGVVTTDTVTGNATGNPQRIQMQQSLTDGDLSATFLKNTYLGKPTITNEIDSTDVTATVVIDASGIPYTSSSTPATVTNTVQVHDPNIPAAAAQFDMATDAQNSTVTAGQYTYTPGSGAGTNLGSRGTYTYIDGGANVNPDWSSYFDDREANPWAYPVNRP